MSYVTRLLLVLTSHAAFQAEIRQQIEQLWKGHGGALEEIMLKFLGAEISPASMFDFEMQVAEEFREFARQLMELAAESDRGG